MCNGSRRNIWGVVVLTNAYPIGFAEALGFTFIDVALYGKATQDWAALFKKVLTLWP
jgi:hypothetical protein